MWLDQRPCQEQHRYDPIDYLAVGSVVEDEESESVVEFLWRLTGFFMPEADIEPGPSLASSLIQPRPQKQFRGFSVAANTRPGQTSNEAILRPNIDVPTL
jgi:hypothetical protein